MPNSPSNLTIQTISATKCLRALFSASVEENEIVAGFLDFQEIEDPTKSNTKPLTDLLEVEQLAQSESQKPVMAKEEELLNSKPNSSVRTKYLNTCNPASK